MVKRVISWILIIVFTALFSIVTSAASQPMIYLILDVDCVNPGESFRCTVYLRNNPGLSALNLHVEFSDALLLIDADCGNIFPAGCSYIPPRQLKSIGYVKESCNFSWLCTDISESETRDGILVSLIFRLSEDADISEEGLIGISVRDKDAVDRNLNAVPFQSFSARIDIGERQPAENNSENDIDRLAHLVYRIVVFFRKILRVVLSFQCV